VPAGLGVRERGCSIALSWSAAHSTIVFRQPEHLGHTHDRGRLRIRGCMRPAAAGRSAGAGADKPRKRLHLAAAPAVERGWVAASRDPVLAPAMALLHAAPERKWTVAKLAAGAAVSRSVLDSRFRQVFGRSPIHYLTEWRMHIAQELRATTELGVAVIARRVGYGAEERSVGRSSAPTDRCSPCLWRTTRSRMVLKSNPRRPAGPQASLEDVEKASHGLPEPGGVRLAHSRGHRHSCSRSS
jgi:AraC-like DNA-binding protein